MGDYGYPTHNTAPTSHEVYRTLDTSEQERQVLAFLGDKESCIADVAKALGMERSTISARMNELKNMGLLEYTGKKKSQSTGVMAMHFRAKVQNPLFGV